MALFTSNGVLKRKLDVFFNDSLQRFDKKNVPHYTAGVGWGLKPSSQQIENLCQQYKVPFARIEDGFIGYVSHPNQNKKLLSIVYDDQGIYYDATQPSQLENLISHKNDECTRGLALIKKIRSVGITKYNLASTPQASVEQTFDVLIIDQTVGDLSIPHSYAVRASFQTMLSNAIAENPNKRIAIKTHPDVILGKKRGHFSPDKQANLIWLTEAIQPSQLFKQKPKVYTVCSLLGFEALIFGCEVTTYGCPFYAGWGLTTHRGKNLERRNVKRSLAQLVEAAYIDYCRYVHPDTNKLCQAEDIIDYIALQKQPMNSVFKAPTVGLNCPNFSLWKRAFLPVFLDAVKVPYSFKGQEKNYTSLRWGRKVGADEIQIEDGFMRSAGLGADLKRPSSLVFDSRGIYFDPTQASDLERIIQHQCLDSAQISRAKKLIEKLRHSGASKYNISGSTTLPTTPKGKNIVLVVGQVEDDASIQCGCVDINTNLGLLNAVRDARPNSYIIYKPHPDVVSGNRKGTIASNELAQLCELNGSDFNIIDLINFSDEVHTLTSLSGFEALVRGKNVTCWGRPFYSDWGLSNDKHTVERRTRTISIEELVYATLIDYPIYINWDTGLFTTPEFIIDQLASQRSQQSNGIKAWLRKTAFVWEALRSVRQ